MKRFSLRRAGCFALATGLLFLIAGDRGVTQIPQGIDPLEVLDLQIKPNVAILLDTSGSMTETPYGSGTPRPDHPGTKMYQAKQVMRQVVASNENNVNFMFGDYLFSATPTWTRCPGGGCTGDYRINTTLTSANSRFAYSTTSWGVQGALPVEGPSPAMAVAATEASLNNLYAWQWIQNSPTVQNNSLTFSENGGPTCTVSITAGFYTATTIGPAIAAAMNTCPGRANTYGVTYTAGTGVFSFSRTVAARTFSLLWTNAATTLDGPMRATANQGAGNGPFATTDTRINLLGRATGDDFTDPVNYDPDGAAGPSPSRPVSTYWLFAQKVWNGETIQVDGTGNACNIIAGAATAPDPTVTLQRLAACGGAAVSTNLFTWSGGQFGGAGTCRTGYKQRVPFFRCDAPANSTSPVIQPFLVNALPLNGTGGISGFTESPDGTGAVLTLPSQGGVTASGNTPMAQSFDGFRFKFGGYAGALSAPLIPPGPPNGAPGPWTGTGQGMWQAGQALPFPQNLSAISTHPNPKEKTIVIMVTDGDQNCTPFVLGGAGTGAPYNPPTMIQDDSAALGAAMAAQKLYDPSANGTGAGTVNADGTINGDPGASVNTYIVAFGNGASATRANWIAWGGSGMRRSGANVGVFSGADTWTTVPTTAERNACKTCVDAFIAPDAASLTDILTKLLNAGATSGEFTANQSLSDSVFEYVGEAPLPGLPFPQVAFNSMNPGTRYKALSPVRIASTFSMPLFTGQVRAYTNDGPNALAQANALCTPNNACQRWDANARLVSRISAGITSVCTAVAGAGVTAGQCGFKRLSGAPSADDSNIGTSLAAIKRRIYTTSQNGVFGPTVDQLLAGQSPFRIALWPPQTASIPTPVAPANDTQEGLLDVAMGLPSNSAPAATHATLFTDLQTRFKACRGTTLPGTCGGSATQQMQRARREAREMILAFLAGAQFIPDVNGDPRRATATVGPDYTAGEILYNGRTSVLAESTLATPAVIGPPQEEEPGGSSWVDEWKLYRDGPRCAGGTCPASGATLGGFGFNSGINPDNGAFIRAGFGLRNPDADEDAPSSGIDSFGLKIPAPDLNQDVKPVMTVTYVGTNSGLHAFRAGPTTNQPPITPDPGTACTPSATVECGGEELWAFVPFDQLDKLQKRYLTNPQKRSPHDYMIAKAIRFSDVFVPNPGTAPNPADPIGQVATKSIGSVNVAIQGVWRKIIYFGRGIGGSYLTAIDVTVPNAFTKLTLDANTRGPIVLWSRGNPDTNDGLPKTGSNVLNNPGTGSGTGSDYDQFLRMGQTWSVPAVAFVDRANAITTRKPTGSDFVLFAGSGYGAAAATPVQGTTFYTLDALTGDLIAAADVGFRSGMAYENAIVGNAAVFNTSRFVFEGASNVAAAKATRAYVGDLHGRVWKILAARPDVAIPMSDLGSNQAVGSAVAIIGLPPDVLGGTPQPKKPHVMVTSGNDPRATGPFHNFGFIDEGDDTNIATLPGVPLNQVVTFPPSRSLFTVDFATNFRGTVQPLVTLSDIDLSTTGQNLVGRVFFGGTRFNPVASQFAPPPEPCRSSFDSQLFALGVESGQPAYDFGPSVIFQNSRMAAVTVGGSPAGSKLIIDEGLVKSGQPVPPPPQMGAPPSTTTSSANVVPLLRPGQPGPMIRFGSSICQ